MDMDWIGCRLIFDKKKELWALQKQEYGDEIGRKYGDDYGYSLAEPFTVEELEPFREGLPKPFYEYLIYVSREIFCYVYPVKLELNQIDAACNSYCKYCKGYESDCDSDCDSDCESKSDTDTEMDDEFPYFLYIGDGGCSFGHYISLCKGREECNRHKYSFGKIAEMADENNHVEQDDFISYLCSIPINQKLLQDIIQYDVYVMKQQKERMKQVLNDIKYCECIN